ncbi:hypothetical protein AVEN_192470-1 [Araneus ventricosus]|uniref:Uncharacterized protein n=1 Tax=Araneus ventricosus TaxID=182803 RepID=A0A4Y2JJZ8_ARAVE|nr:hypothetical protein AVEN_192470-1 [Araneus ventricosus]
MFQNGRADVGDAYREGRPSTSRNAEIVTSGVVTGGEDDIEASGATFWERRGFKTSLRLCHFLKQNMLTGRKNNDMPQSLFTLAKPLMTTGVKRNDVIPRLPLNLATPLAMLTKR